MKNVRKLFLIFFIGYGLIFVGGETKVEAASWNDFVNWFFGQPKCEPKLKFDSKGFVVKTTYCPKVIKSEMPFGPGSVKGIQSIISKANFIKTTSKKTRIYHKKGSYTNAVSDFNSLKPKMLKNESGLKVGELNEGTRVNVRSYSSEGSPTLEFYQGKKSVKIRYIKE